MINTKKNKYLLIAACCYAFLVIKNITNKIEYIKLGIDSKVSPLDVIYWIIGAFLIVSLLLGKKKPIIASLAVFAVYEIYECTRFKSSITANPGNWFFLCPLLGIALASCATIVLLSITAEQSNELVKLWFLPFILSAIGEIIYDVIAGGLSNSNIKYRIIGLLPSICFLFISLWIRETLFQPANDDPITSVSSPTSETSTQGSTPDGTDIN